MIQLTEDEYHTIWQALSSAQDELSAIADGLPDLVEDEPMNKIENAFSILINARNRTE